MHLQCQLSHYIIINHAHEPTHVSKQVAMFFGVDKFRLGRILWLRHRAALPVPPAQLPQPQPPPRRGSSGGSSGSSSGASSESGDSSDSSSEGAVTAAVITAAPAEEAMDRAAGGAKAPARAPAAPSPANAPPVASGPGGNKWGDDNGAAEHTTMFTLWVRWFCRLLLVLLVNHPPHSLPPESAC
jgi:hypothetical protein